MSKYKFWRLSNVVYRSSLPADRDNGSVAEIKFATSDFEYSTLSMGTPMSSSHPVDFPEGAPDRAFDGDRNSYSISEYSTKGKGRRGWWIGFEFHKPVEVVAVVVGQTTIEGHVWYSAHVDCSEDGVKWEKYAEIVPDFEPGHLGLKSCILVNRTAPPPERKFDAIDYLAKAYRYWKITDLKYFEDGDEGLGLKTFRMFYSETEEATDPSKLTVFNEGANKSVLLNTSPSDVYTSQVDVRDPRWYIQYDFEKDVKLTGFIIEYDETRPYTKIREFIVSGSHDGLNWDNVSKTLLPNAQRVVQSVRREDAFRVIGSFPYNPDIRWWQSVLTANCLYAFDARSEVSEDGSTIKRVDDPTKGLTRSSNSPATIPTKVENILGNVLEKKQQYPKDIKELFKYEGLRFDGGVYEFSPIIEPVRDFTVILRFVPFALTNNEQWGGVKLKQGYLVNTFENRWIQPRSTSRAGYSPHDLNFYAFTYNSLTGESYSYGSIRSYPDQMERISPSADDTSSVGYYRKSLRFFNSTNASVKTTGDLIATAMWDAPLSEEDIFRVLTQIDGEFVNKAEPVYLSRVVHTNAYQDTIKLCLNYHKASIKDSFNFFKPNRKGNSWYQIWNMPSPAIITTAPYIKTYTIEDIVTKEEVPTLSKMYLYEKYSGELLASVWSHPTTGIFTFRGVRAGQEYIVTSWDKDLEYRSIIKDYN